jgi:hypothetical protein
MSSYHLSSEKKTINSSIPKWCDINKGKTMHWRNKMSTSQLLVCCYVNLKMEGCITFLPPWIVNEQLALDGITRLWQFILGTWELLELENWKPNKLWTLFLSRWSKENLTFSKVVTSFWVKLIPFWMGHIVGI